MSFAIFKVMVLGLVRDRGTLVMSFVLPPLIYLIFASIFAGAMGDTLAVRVALLDEVKSETTMRLARALREDTALHAAFRDPQSRAELELQIRTDQADVGVVLRADPGESGKEPAVSPVLVFGDAAKSAAAATVAGQVQRIFGEKLPDTAYRRVLADFERTIVPFTPEQRKRADGILDFVGRAATGVASPAVQEAVAKRSTPPFVQQVQLASTSAAPAAVVYYAGAVAILFLMYSAMHGAMSLIDERQSGIAGRILQGSTGVGRLLLGKFWFLVLQGIVQAGLIFALAAVVYGVDVVGHWPILLAITIAASASSAGLGLALAAACRTRQQAQTLSTFLVLVLAALGGSMVPRFLMPAWLQDVSWAIPNAWVIEAYHGVLWRNAATIDVLPLIGAMVVFSAATMVLAWATVRFARPI